MNLFERLVTRQERPKIQVDDEISPVLNDAELNDLFDCSYVFNNVDKIYNAFLKDVDL